MANNFNISDLPPASGSTAGLLRAVILGENQDIDTGTLPEDVWKGADLPVGAQSLYVFPLVAETMDIVSNNAADTAAGTGAQSVTIEGLDAAFNSISETIALAGLGIVTTVNAYFRINDMRVDTAGSGGFNAGFITATQSTSAILTSVMGPLDNRALQAIFTVPAEWSTGAVITMAAISVGKQATVEAEVKLLISPTSGAPFIVGGIGNLNSQGSSATAIVVPVSAQFPIGADFVWRVTFLSASNAGIDVFTNFAENK